VGGVRDGRIEADLTLVSGVAQQNACGLVLRYQEDGSCYILELAGDGSYAFWRLEGNELVGLVDWTTSSAIRPLGQTNHVEVVLSGSSFTIRVNGTFLFATTDTRLSSGAVGVFVDCISAGSAEARFDNFKIWSQ
ncbi:MAG: hypothetical protein JXA57_10235, partial [Armatimonadetes bacterium]|nr:hypothetical protein [Armatimonadota bacterium]